MKDEFNPLEELKNSTDDQLFTMLKQALNGEGRISQGIALAYVCAEILRRKIEDELS